jgi:hypothetical protein
MPAELAQRMQEPRRPLGRYAPLSRKSRQRLAQACAEDRGRAHGTRSLELAREPLARHLEHSSIAQQLLDRRARHAIGAVEKRQTQPMNDFIEAQTPCQQPQAQQRMGDHREVRERTAALDRENIRRRAWRRIHPVRRGQRLGKDAVVKSASLAQLGVDDEETARGIGLELLAAPRGDELQFMVVIIGAGDVYGRHRARRFDDTRVPTMQCLLW